MLKKEIHCRYCTIYKWVIGIIIAIAIGIISFLGGTKLSQKEICEITENYLNAKKTPSANLVFPILIKEYEIIINKYHKSMLGFESKPWNKLTINEQIEKLKIFSKFERKENKISKLLE